MGDRMTDELKGPLDRTYGHLLTLWTSGVRDYHSMLSDYLTANSIFVAVLGLLVSRESLSLPIMVLIVLLVYIWAAPLPANGDRARPILRTERALGMAAARDRAKPRMAWPVTPNKSLSPPHNSGADRGPAE